MKGLILILSVLCFQTQALEGLSLTQGNVELLSPQRVNIEAQDVSINFGSFSIGNPLPFGELSFGENELKFQMGDTSFSYHHQGEGFFSEVQGLEAQGLEAHYQKERLISVSTQSVMLDLASRQIRIPQFSLRCEKNYTKFIEDLSLCLEVAKFYAPVINLDQLTIQKFKEAFPTPQNKGLEELEEISLSIFNGELYLTFKARFLFKWKVKISGRADFDSEKAQLRLAVHSAKVGFLSIKKTLMRKIEEANIKNLSVVGDTLILTL